MFKLQLKSLFRDRRGLSTVEYTVLLVLIVSGSIAAWKSVGTALYSKINKGATDIGGIQAEDVQGGGGSGTSSGKSN